jgi:cellulose synthase/poly-beta-1,6-N-acetylglucosamine synthase-like glycosyltransferase
LGITIQLAYVLCVFAGIFSIKSSSQPVNQSTSQPVSTIICAKNEATNLRQNLPSILAQRYMNESGKPMYEVIVVNDASVDDTERVLYELLKQYDNLRVVTIAADTDRNLPGKKYALSKGVEAAANNILLLTDADCRPSSPNWIYYMVQPLLQGKVIAAGVGKYEQKHGLLNAFIRWETMNSFLQYASYTTAGMPYMAVGRNLACTKDALLKAQQSEAWAKLPSGDDDLLVNAVANKENIAIVAHPAAHTLSPAKPTWADWVKQKQRHVSTSKYYKAKVVLSLGIYASAHALVWLLLLPLLFVWDWQIVLGVMACRTLIYLLLWTMTAQQMEEKFTLRQYLLFDIGWMVYNFAFSPYIIWKNKQQWT